MAALPLDGFVIGVTADRRAEEQCEMLRRRGARVLHGPSIRAVALAPDEGVRAATEALIASPPDILVANTGVGIRSWFAAAESWGLGHALVESLAGARVLARGPKAAGAVLTGGLEVPWRAPSETLAEAVTEVLHSAQPGTSVAVQLDGKPEQRQVDRLVAAGYPVTAVRIYEWHEATETEPAVRLLDAVCDHRVHAITFTSSAAVVGFAALADRHGRSGEFRAAVNGPVLAVCVGPVCAQAAADIGVESVHPDRPRLGAMVHWLTAELSARRRHLCLAGTDVVLQGSLLTIDGRRIDLTDQERSILGVLVARNGAVVSASELLRTIWASSADRHVLEVAIARLRKTLGAAAPALRTVTRRGYRLQID